MDHRLLIIILAILLPTGSLAGKANDSVGNVMPKPWIGLHAPQFDTTDISIPVDAPAPKEEHIRSLPKSEEQMWWWNLAKKGKLNLQDTAVIYPKFIKFCVDVYNWGDRFFNSYDPQYVVGTGKRWKVRILNDNWVDSYAMTLPGGLKTQMLSNLYSNIGGYIQYMAVSVGTTYDIGRFFSNDPIKHKKWEFGFNCALFNAEIYYHENTGGTYLRKFGKYKDGKIFKMNFPGVELYNLGIEAYYFFNNKRYSQGAAYNFSKFQKKSQGSFLAGFTYSDLKVGFNFHELPIQLKPYLTIPVNSYLFHYKSYSILFGYGYNWVIKPRLLFNITAMPSVGLSHCYEDSLEGKKYMVAMNVNARTSLTYNLGNFFFSLIGKMNGHWYKSATYSLFSSVENFSANIGFRF